MANCKSAVLRTGRRVDTSPPNWELRSAAERRNVYKRQPTLDEQISSRQGLYGVSTLAFVNERAALGALGVNMLARKRFW